MLGQGMGVTSTSPWECSLNQVSSGAGHEPRRSVVAAFDGYRLDRRLLDHLARNGLTVLGLLPLVNHDHKRAPVTGAAIHLRHAVRQARGNGQRGQARRHPWCKIVIPFSSTKPIIFVGVSVLRMSMMLAGFLPNMVENTCSIRALVVRRSSSRRKTLQTLNPAPSFESSDPWGCCSANDVPKK